MNIRSLLILILVAFNVGLDQVSKEIVRETVVPGSRTELLGKQLQLMNVENSGAFLSMGSDSNPTVKLIFLLILPVIVLGVVLYYVDKSFPEFELTQNQLSIGILFSVVFMVGIFITWWSTFFATQRFLNLKTDQLY